MIRFYFTSAVKFGCGDGETSLLIFYKNKREEKEIFSSARLRGDHVLREQMKGKKDRLLSSVNGS